MALAAPPPLDWPVGLFKDGLWVPGRGYSIQQDYANDFDLVSRRCAPQWLEDSSSSPFSGADDDGTGANDTDYHCYHGGIDIHRDGDAVSDPDKATADFVYAAGDGIVIGRADTSVGRGVLIQHASDVYAYYLHLDSNKSPTVEIGQPVRRGQPIGVIGEYYAERHFHFEVRPGPKVKLLNGSLDCYGVGYALESNPSPYAPATLSDWGFGDPIGYYFAHRPQFPTLVTFDDAAPDTTLYTAPDASSTAITSLGSGWHHATSFLYTASGLFYMVDPPNTAPGFVLAYERETVDHFTGNIHATEAVRWGDSPMISAASGLAPRMELRFGQCDPQNTGSQGYLDDSLGGSPVTSAGNISFDAPYPYLDQAHDPGGTAPLYGHYCDRAAKLGAGARFTKTLPDEQCFAGGLAIELDANLAAIGGERVLVERRSAEDPGGVSGFRLAVSPSGGALTLTFSVARADGWSSVSANLPGPQIRPLAAASTDCGPLPSDADAECAGADPVTKPKCFADLGYRQWRHLGALYQADTSQIAIYYDGELLAAQPVPGPMVDEPGPVHVGDADLGMINDVKVWGDGDRTGAPTGVQYHQNQAELSWSAPAGAPADTTYEVCVRTTTQSDAEQSCAVTQTTSIDLSSAVFGFTFLDGVQYHAVVKAQGPCATPSVPRTFTFSDFLTVVPGLVSVGASPAVISPLNDPEAMVDGDEIAYSIINYTSAEPVAVTLQYDSPTEVSGFSAVMGGFHDDPLAYTWKVEAADTLASLDTNSPANLVLGDTFAYTLATLQFPQPVTAKFFRFTAKRNDYDQKLHAHELTPIQAPLPGGAVSGRVSTSGSSPVAGATVQICPSAGVCRVTITNAAGHYGVSGLPVGLYTVKALPPASSTLRAKSTAPFLVSGGAVTGKNLALTEPVPPPPGTSISSVGATPAGIPIVYWASPLELETTGCSGGAATFTISKDGVVLRTGSLGESPPGSYSATILPLQPAHGDADVSVHVDCPAGPDDDTAFSIYIDPSGFVREPDGTPIDGATVTLYRADHETGPFFEVPDGSGVMSPMNRKNPDTTSPDGHFGWDVLAGYYKVVAHKPGCVSPDDPGLDFVETEVLTIPPPVTDLDLRLDCSALEPCAPVAGCVTIKRGVAGDVFDAMLSGDYPSWKSGTDVSLFIGQSSAGNENRVLFGFDLSPVPEGAAVTSAVLSLQIGWNAAFNDLSVFRVTQPWSEATVSLSSFGPAGHDPTPIAVFPGGGVGVRQIDLTPLVSAWVDGTTPNHGVLVRDELPAKHMTYSAESGKAPSLDICYTTCE